MTSRGNILIPVKDFSNGQDPNRREDAEFPTDFAILKVSDPDVIPAVNELLARFNNAPLLELKFPSDVFRDDDVVEFLRAEQEVSVTKGMVTDNEDVVRRRLGLMTLAPSPPRSSAPAAAAPRQPAEPSRPDVRSSPEDIVVGNSQSNVRKDPAPKKDAQPTPSAFNASAAQPKPVQSRSTTGSNHSSSSTASPPSVPSFSASPPLEIVVKEEEKVDDYLLVRDGSYSAHESGFPLFRSNSPIKNEMMMDTLEYTGPSSTSTASANENAMSSPTVAINAPSIPSNAGSNDSTMYQEPLPKPPSPRVGNAIIEKMEEMLKLRARTSNEPLKMSDVRDFNITDDDRLESDFFHQDFASNDASIVPPVSQDGRKRRVILPRPEGYKRTREVIASNPQPISGNGHMTHVDEDYEYRQIGEQLRNEMLAESAEKFPSPYWRERADDGTLLETKEEEALFDASIDSAPLLKANEATSLPPLPSYDAVTSAPHKFAPVDITKGVASAQPHPALTRILSTCTPKPPFPTKSFPDPTPRLPYAPAYTAPGESPQKAAPSVFNLDSLSSLPSKAGGESRLEEGRKILQKAVLVPASPLDGIFEKLMHERAKKERAEKRAAAEKQRAVDEEKRKRERREKFLMAPAVRPPAPPSSSSSSSSSCSSTRSPSVDSLRSESSGGSLPVPDGEAELGHDGSPPKSSSSKRKQAMRKSNSPEEPIAMVAGGVKKKKKKPKKPEEPEKPASPLTHTQCMLCNKWFDKEEKQKIRYHVLYHCPMKAFQCRHCRYSHHEQGKIKRHQHNVHKTPVDTVATPEDVRRARAPLCFDNELMTAIHEVWMQKSFPMFDTGKLSIGRMTNYTNHIEPTHDCAICPTKQGSKIYESLRAVHLVDVHGDIQVFKCDVRGCRFKSVFARQIVIHKQACHNIESSIEIVPTSIDYTDDTTFLSKSAFPTSLDLKDDPIQKEFLRVLDLMHMSNDELDTELRHLLMKQDGLTHIGQVRLPPGVVCMVCKPLGKDAPMRDIYDMVLHMKQHIIEEEHLQWECGEQGCFFSSHYKFKVDVHMLEKHRYSEEKALNRWHQLILHYGQQHLTCFPGRGLPGTRNPMDPRSYPSGNPDADLKPKIEGMWNLEKRM